MPVAELVEAPFAPHRTVDRCWRVVRNRNIERRVEEHEFIETAVLSLSVHDEASIEF